MKQTSLTFITFRHNIFIVQDTELATVVKDFVVEAWLFLSFQVLAESFKNKFKHMLPFPRHLAEKNNSLKN
jgi:hypothetical protein